VCQTDGLRATEGVAMDQHAIESCLKRRRRRNAALELGLALIWALCAAFFLLVTYWLIYAALLLGFRWIIPHSHDTRLILSGAGLLILFIGNARTSRQYLESLSFTTGTASEEVVTIYIPGVGLGSNVNPLAPDSIHSNVKLITTGLFCGPRLTVGRCSDGFIVGRRNRGWQYRSCGQVRHQACREEPTKGTRPFHVCLGTRVLRQRSRSLVVEGTPNAPGKDTSSGAMIDLHSRGTCAVIEQTLTALLSTSTRARYLPSESP